MEKVEEAKLSNKNTKKNNLKYFLFIIIIIIYFLCFFNELPLIKLKIKFEDKISKMNITTDKLGNFEIDENYPEDYEKHVLDRIMTRLKGPHIMSVSEYYFINGLIRKYKPKKILEIGVCSGGMSAIILNAIFDRNDSFLYSCDLESKNYVYSNYEVGSVVKTYFPEFLSKWKLYTGNTTAAFIEEIGGDIDFVFIDTAHVMPGEVLNMIEIFPFLKKGAIIGFDDIDHQARTPLYNVNFFYPCNNLLFSVLRGKKIIFGQKNNDTFHYRKQGAVILDKDQENYFYEYFYLLTNNWSYMPNQFEIDVIRNLVAKYYKPFFLSIFDEAVRLNYEKLKINGLLKKDYILYTFKNIIRNNSI